MIIPMKTMTILFTSLFCLQVFACIQDNSPQQDELQQEQTTDMQLKITVGKATFSATLQSNATAKAFQERLPLTLTMNDLNRNEKYIDLPERLPSNASNPGTIQNGDLMLYGSNTLVLFYKSFSTSYSYTRIGKITDPAGLAEALGSGTVDVTFELE